MSLEIRIPSVGESVTSATLSRWHVADGDYVAKDALLVTLETDKVAQELQAEEAGRIKLLVKEGEEVEIGTLVATIDTSATAPAEGKSQPAPAGKPDSGKAETAPAPTEAESGPPPKTRGPEQEAPPPRQAPKAPASVPPPVPPVAREGRETRRKMSPLRRKIAAHLVSAQHTAAILTTFNECDMSGVMAMRKALQDDFVKRHGLKLGFMSFFIKATVDALRAVPQINARIEDGELVEQHYYDISIAVGTEKGLVVPVIRDCDRKSFAQLEADILDLAAKARDNKLELADLKGGVFTISNGGVYGSLLSTPILNPPQSGILGMHSIKERPVAVDGQVVIRPMMNLALSYDHRIVDGKEAVLFLARVKDCIENPSRLLVGA